MRAMTFATMLAVTVSSASCSRTPEPIRPGVDTFYYGYVTTGKKLGVTVGQPRAEVMRILARSQDEYYGEQRCRAATQTFVACPTNAPFDLYRRHGVVRDGQIYVTFAGDRVTGIAWSFNYGIAL